jgi:hypothetical protein
MICQQRCGSGNETIDNYRNSLRCASQDDAAQASDFKTPDFCQDIYRVFGLGWLSSIAFLIVATLFFKVASSMPVPLPVTSEIFLPVKR